MSGPAPKAPEQRARLNTPARGEWQTLPELARPVLPAALPWRSGVEGPWSYRTRRAWKGWRADWATQVFTAAEIAQVGQLAYLFEDAVRGRPIWNEVRQWTDRLGLNPKGKRDLRLRLAEPAAVAPIRGKQDKPAVKAPALKLVGDALVSK